ncbi:hypothetical protein GTQ34_03325 [Muricauda sp. JGD-17]|uniref:Uncharacterized protein n=1 Tax=Flagellimonas ochracea TaxID=2696472 RepID=A0A964WWG1_9FLAO|nr:hypothetical protein [Allomuricauda ochracea]NAY90940.1 hypothetical protein [Allomuricauda ochracea]
MKSVIPKIYSLFFMGLTFFVLQSCSEDAENGNIEQELTQTEVQTIMETDQVTGVADSALAELYAGNGMSGKVAKSNDCYAAEYTENGFTATFNNCVLNGTENVNGTLTVVYEVGGEAASFTANYEDFYVGTIKVNGTRTYVIAGEMTGNSISFSVTSDVSVEFEDGETIAETGTKTFTFTFGEDLQSSSFGLSGSWTVQADGNTYMVETLEDLQGSLSCQYLTSGSMEISKNGLQVAVDFGDGECDDTATVTYPNGATEEITL